MRKRAADSQPLCGLVPGLLTYVHHRASCGHGVGLWEVVVDALKLPLRDGKTNLECEHACFEYSRGLSRAKLDELLQESQLLGLGEVSKTPQNRD